jgi:hypothetical protein
MYLSFPACIPLLEDPVREALAMAVMDDDAHGASRILWASEDLAELLPDAFLTPTLMQMAESGSTRLFRAFGEFGFGYNTLLVSPDTGEEVMALGHWAALTLSPERLRVLMGQDSENFDRNFNVVDRHDVPGIHGDLYVSSLVRGVCEGKGEVWEFWKDELVATLKGEREPELEEDESRWDRDLNAVLVRREIPTLFRLMRGLEMMAENGEPGVVPDYNRFDSVLECLAPVVWNSGDGHEAPFEVFFETGGLEGNDLNDAKPATAPFNPWSGFLKDSLVLPFPVMTRVVRWMSERFGAPDPAWLSDVEKMKTVTYVALADNSLLPEDPFHVGLLAEKILATARERGDLVGTWTRLVDRMGPTHPVLAGLPGFLKAGSVPVTARTLLGLKPAGEQYEALDLYRALPMAASPVRTLRL